MIKDINDEPKFPKIIKSISIQIQMSVLFKTNNESKRSRCDISINHVMIITVDIHKTKKVLCYSLTKSCM